VLFQFSHHLLDKEGRIAHNAQCLVATPGVLPNAAVVRALKQVLSQDEGTVLHWWSHERTVLQEVSRELQDGLARDAAELAAFIHDLLTPEEGPGARLVDLGLPVVSRLTYFAGTGGSSSIKSVLPVVLQQSDHLQQKFTQPIYATPAMPSLNFKQPVSWVQFEGGRVKDPYGLLAPDTTASAIDRLIAQGRSAVDDSVAYIRNGGGAMLAYGQLQRPDLHSDDRARLEGQLKRYCELDSLAMVMIYEALREWINR
jgi:hypothetical protein